MFLWTENIPQKYTPKYTPKIYPNIYPKNIPQKYTAKIYPKNIPQKLLVQYLLLTSIHKHFALNKDSTELISNKFGMESYIQKGDTGLLRFN